MFRVVDETKPLYERYAPVLWHGLTPARSYLRVHLPALLMLFGFVLLLYVGAQYGMMIREQRKLSAEWEEQNRMVRQEVMKKPGEEAAAREVMTRLTIPKIDLDAFVVNGTTRKHLLLGPGLLEKSPAPGELGNSVITAHRDTFFRHIYELQRGDEILVRRSGRTYKYQVTGKKIVDPADISVLKQTKQPRLTLITCYPTYMIGPAPERLVVFSKLIDRSDSPLSAADAVAGANH
jgi:sortase A